MAETPETNKADCCLLCSFGGVYCLKTITPDQILKGLTEDVNMIRSSFKEANKCTNETHETCCKAIEYDQVLGGIMKIFSNDFFKMFEFLQNIGKYSVSFYQMVQDAKKLKVKEVEQRN